MPNYVNSARIAKNTLLLYARMFLMMLIGLYTSRVILNALGLSDLGLFNVASSVVGMFTFMNATLASGTQRFLTYEIGTGDKEQLNRVFRSAMTLHGALAIIIVFLSETIGLWYVYNKLNVEPSRFTAAIWCFHLTVIATVISIIQLPFSAALIAHEKMSVYAYMSIFDASVKLLSAFLIQLVSFDKVIFYAVLLLFFNIISTIVYNIYCQKKFQECRFRFGYDKDIFKDMLTFSGWNTVGCIAAMGQSTGVNLAINYFCGTVVNGARGIAFQANSWVMRFVDNFQVALNPQIVKYYAGGEIKEMSRLVVKGAQFSSYLLLLLGIPLFIEIEWIIGIWLGQCPDYVPIFLRIILIESLFHAIGNPTITAMHATGEMKVLNITVGSILLLILPVSILLFKCGLSVEIVVAANVIPWVIVIPVRLTLLKHICDFPMRDFLVKALMKPCLIAIAAFIPAYGVSKVGISSPFLSFIIVASASLLTTSLIIYFFGLETDSKEIIREKAAKLLRQC